MPRPADFAGPPSRTLLHRWKEADRAARPARLERVRERLAANRLDAFFGVRRETSRYLTGFTLAEGEEKVAGHSGQFFVSPDDIVLLADSRYRVQARQDSDAARVETVTYDLPARWPDLLASMGTRRLGLEAAAIDHALWVRLAGAAPDVEHIPVEGWVEADRANKEPSEVERITAACAVADRALARLLPTIQPGMTEADLAWRLEAYVRTGGAEALAFDVACLAGPDAALPHGSPGPRRIRAGDVILFDFGAQVAGYRNDMTRTLFVGEPQPRQLAVYEIVAAAQRSAIELLRNAARDGHRPTGPAIDLAARRVIEAAGHGARFGHGTGHGIGLATHEQPRLSRTAPNDPLPSPTVFSVEPGIYLDGRFGVRIEDLVLFDADAHRLELLTQFPREVFVVGVS